MKNRTNTFLALLTTSFLMGSSFAYTNNPSTPPSDNLNERKQEMKDHRAMKDANRSMQEADRSMQARHDEAKSHKNVSDSSVKRVKAAQNKLKERGFKVNTVDGVIGPETMAAVKEFQNEEGLEETGRLNHDTLSALEINYMKKDMNTQDEVYSE